MTQTPGTLIVTGGSRGIGAAVCRLAAREGYAVAVNFHSQETAANAVVQEIRQAGGRVTAIRADIGKEADVLRLFEQAEEQLGALGALVNNAAITGGFARCDALCARGGEAPLDGVRR